MPDEHDDTPLPSRFAIVRRSIWQLVRSGARRAPADGNYAEDHGPRFFGGRGEGGAGADAAGALRVVSFNIDHGREVARAAALLGDDPSLHGADIVLLQEMEERGTSRIAESLGMAHVYYPAGRHPVSGRHFGNAVLARGDIVRDTKHLLPHLGRVRGTRRIAVAATVSVRGRLLTAISVHLATLLDASLEAQRDQLAAVLDAAEGVETPVVIGGDLNRRALGLIVERRGYRWLTRDVGPTFGPFAIDHLFVRGDDRDVPHAAGVVRDVRGASDHRPVWSTLKLSG